MTTALALAAILTAALVVLLAAERYHWQPAMPAALGVALVFRIAVAALAAHNSWQPYDFINDFPAAALAVLHHQDPLLTARVGGWHFLPPMAYICAAMLKLGTSLGIGWPVIGRVVPVVADLANVVLVGRLAQRVPATRRLQYAVNPVAIMVCAIHGQIEPVALAFGLGALLLARRGRAGWAGLAIGAALAVNTWPVLILPGVVLFVRGWRARAIVLAGAVVVPLAFLLTIPLAAGGGWTGLVAAVHVLAHTRPVTGTWGWGAVVDLLGGSGGLLVVSPVLGLLGDLAILVGLFLVAYRWRRADPLTLVTALIAVFLVCTTRFGTQYLAWIAPFLNARPNRWSNRVLILASLWAGTGYLYLTTLPQASYWVANGRWSVASLVVVAGLVLLLFESRPRGVQRLPLNTAAAPSSPALVE